MYFPAQLLFTPGLLQSFKARRLVTDDREVRLIQRYRDTFWIGYFGRVPMVSFFFFDEDPFWILSKMKVSKFHFSKTILIEAVQRFAGWVTTTLLSSSRGGELGKASRTSWESMNGARMDLGIISFPSKSPYASSLCPYNLLQKWKALQGPWCKGPGVA